MKKSLAGLLCTLAVLSFTQLESKAVVGYVNQVWPEDGYILINNPLNYPSGNTLSNLFTPAPLGITVELWDPVANDFTPASYVNPASGAWTIQYDLPPGVGARIYSPVSYTNTYVGEALTGDGTPPVDGAEPPSPFTGPDGTYLLGTITPIAVSGEDVFLWTLGRGPNVGEKVTTFDPLTQMYSTTTYQGPSTWDNGTPSLDVAESAFFIIPEPTTFSLLGLGSLALVMMRRRR